MSITYVGHLLHAQIEGISQGVCRECIYWRIECNACVLRRSIVAEQRYLGVTKGLTQGDYRLHGVMS